MYLVSYFYLEDIFFVYCMFLIKRYSLEIEKLRVRLLNLEC